MLPYRALHIITAAALLLCMCVSKKGKGSPSEMGDNFVEVERGPDDDPRAKKFKMKPEEMSKKTKAFEVVAKIVPAIRCVACTELARNFSVLVKENKYQSE